VNRSSVAHILENLRDFLESESAFLLTDEDRHAFLLRTQRALEKVAAPGESLYVGILGGTGVGKSTLINALAGRAISDPSDRRPFTDRAVVYRHKDTARGLDNVSHLMRDPDALHEIEAIKDLVLLDLPDFDSVELSKRRSVIEIMPMLDAVVWVASPEKYADAPLYEMVGQTAVHRENFTFVLNKADQLVEPGAPDPHWRLKDALGDFLFRLKHEAGIEPPRLFGLSAGLEISGLDENPVLREDFERFREFLMARRDAKEVASVKTANLVEETRRLVANVVERVRPDERSRILDAAGLQPPAGMQSAPPETLGGALEERRLAAALLKVFRSADPSIAPVAIAMRLIALGRTDAQLVASQSADEIFRAAAEPMARERRGELEAVTARIDAELMMGFHHVSAPPESRPEALVNRAVKEAAAAFGLRVEQRLAFRTGRFSRLTRAWQKLVLLSPVPVMILKLAHPMAVGAWMDHPTVTGFLRITVNLLTSLFGTEGLAALAGLCLCEVILTSFLAARRIKKIERESHSIAKESLRGLESSLDRAARAAETERNRDIERIQTGIERVNALRGAFGA